MARTQRYSQAEIIDALTATRGLVTFAARRLGCDPDTVTLYCHRYPKVRAARDTGRERQLDLAEAQLFTAIDAGEAWAIQFLLRTVGRRRGYGDHLEIEGTVDVLQSAEWIQLRGLLLETLAAFPEARAAVVTRLATVAAPALPPPPRAGERPS
jgi:hypothetical protein